MTGCGEVYSLYCYSISLVGLTINNNNIKPESDTF